MENEQEGVALMEVKVEVPPPPPPAALLHLHPPYTQKGRHDYQMKGRLLYLAATEGNREIVQNIIKNDSSAVSAYITEGMETPLHMAALADKVQLVENLVSRMSYQDLAIKNKKGNTALIFAAFNGNVEIAKLMIDKNPELPRICGLDGVSPLLMAARLGNRDFVEYLRSWLRMNDWTEEDEGLKLLTTCIDANLFDVALNIVNDNRELAVAQEINGETALDLLAKKPLAFTRGNQKGKWRKLFFSYAIMEETHDENLLRFQAYELAKRILEIVFNQDDLEVSHIIERAPHLLFVSAEEGNFEFLYLLLHHYPELILKVDENNQSIFHYAIKHRHESIFTLLHKNDAFRNLVTKYVDNTTGNNMLHLAAKLAPHNKLNMVSGEAFQMQQEIMWYKEVEKMVQPSYRNMRNSDGNTPSDVFDSEHEDLLADGERWMKTTAKSCMLVATLIDTVIFTAAFTVPGGNDNNGYPVLYRKILFEFFSISESLGLFTSSTSILIFLSILTSRVNKNDFLQILPCKLMVGVTALFVSIAAMVIAFCTTIFLSYRHASTGIPILLLLFACVPIMFIALKFRLLVDIIHSTFVSRFLYWSRNDLVHANPI